jgi:hypothetical protein
MNRKTESRKWKLENNRESGASGVLHNRVTPEPPHPARREALFPRAALSPKGVWVITRKNVISTSFASCSFVDRKRVNPPDKKWHPVEIKVVTQTPKGARAKIT